MYQKALSIYYALLMFVVGTALFVMYPSGSQELSVWQGDVKQQFSIAFEQTVGDQPWFGEVGSIYDAVAGFYDESTDATVALLTQPESDEDLIYVMSKVYTSFAQAVNPDHSNAITGVVYDEILLPPMPANFMTMEPLYNIVPYKTVVKTVNTEGSVSGASISTDQPVNADNSWVTIQDNMTGQLYCLAVYNGTVNKYLGPCKYDDYH